MTLSSSVSKTLYTGNGVTTDFATGFKFNENGHVDVYVDDVLQTEITDYTLTGEDNPAGGTVAFVTAPADQSSVVIIRDVPYIQETDYISGDPFPAETHEAALDFLTMQTQQNETKIGRAIRVPESDSLTDAELTLSDATGRAQTLVGFDQSGAMTEIPYNSLSTPIVISETQTLVDGQTAVSFGVDTTYASIHISGIDADDGRLVAGIDYQINPDGSIVLTESYPAGTYITAASNDVGDTNENTVYQATYDTVAAMKAAPLSVAQAVSTLGYYVAGDGGGAEYLVAASQAVDGYLDHSLASGNVALVQLENNTLSFKQAGAQEATDTYAVFSAINAYKTANPNVQKLIIEPGNYILNEPGASEGWVIPSNLVVSAYGAVFSTTNTTAFGWRTERGATNVKLAGAEFVGFAVAATFYDATDCTMMHMVSRDPTNKGFVAQGHLCDRNFFIECETYRPVFHGFNCDQSSDFAPTSVDRDDANYPIRTTFIRCYCEGQASQTGYAFDAHSNGVTGGLTSLIDCQARDTTLFFKNQHGPLLVDGGYWKKGATANATITTGDGYLMLLGSWRNDNGGGCVVKNAVFETAVDDTVMIVEGTAKVVDCEFRIQNNAKINLGKFNLASGDSFDFIRNRITSPDGTHTGMNLDSAGLFFTDDTNPMDYERIAVKDCDFLVPMILTSTSNALFNLGNDFTCKNLIIENNKFEMDATAANTSRLLDFGGTTTSGDVNIDDLQVLNNVVTNITLVIRILTNATCRQARIEDNNNVSLYNRWPTVFERLTIKNNLPRDIYIVETAPTVGSPTTLISNVNGGEVFKVTFATDRNNGGAGIHGFEEHYVALSRDGTALASSLLTSFNSANVGAVLSLNGSDIEYYAAFAARMYINVERIKRYY
jgi:hypothetical protein